MVHRYLKIHFDRVVQLQAPHVTDPYVILQVGDAHANSPIGRIQGPGSWSFNQTAIFEALQGLSITIFILDRTANVSLASGMVDMTPYLTSRKMRKSEIRLHPTGVALVRCQLFDFDQAGDFPDRLEVHVSHATGLPAQMRNPRVRVTVAGESLLSESPTNTGEHTERVIWNQRFLMSYKGSELCQIDVLDESGKVACAGRYLLWDVLTVADKRLGGEIDLTDDSTMPSGLMRIAFKMWDTKTSKVKTDVQADRLTKLIARRQDDLALAEFVRDAVQDSDRRNLLECDRKLDAAGKHLERGQDVLNALAIPSRSKADAHGLKREIKYQMQNCERALEAAERSLQLLTHAATIKEWTLTTGSRSRIEQIARDMDSARQPMPGNDADDAQLESLHRDRLAPLIVKADEAVENVNSALNGIKGTMNASEMRKHNQDAQANRIKAEELALEADQIGLLVSQRLRERRRTMRQQARSNMLASTFAAGAGDFPKPLIVPAPCCCWL